MSKLEANIRQRAALHKSQGGRCHYCCDPIGAQLGEQGDPVLEHHTPRCIGGKRRHLVLACGWCDKKKGMMHGAEFTTLIQQHMVDGVLSVKARVSVGGLAKARNLELQEAHNVSRGAPSSHLRLPWRRSQVRLAHAVFGCGEAAYSDAGNSGRDAFIKAWEEDQNPHA